MFTPLKAGGDFGTAVLWRKSARQSNDIMNNTPRTNSAILPWVANTQTAHFGDCVTADFARQLERELTDAKAELATIKNPDRKFYVIGYGMRFEAYPFAVVISTERGASKLKERFKKSDSKMEVLESKGWHSIREMDNHFSTILKKGKKPSY